MALPPGGLPEIVFSFDTTGSMSSCLEEVRGRISDMIQRLQADIPAIRIAVFAHGDYCDKHNYVTKWVDFTTDVKKLCKFVKTVTSTGGGDSDECYELVLRQVGEELSWTPGSNRALIMIGDANPHGPTYPDNKLKIDWKKEIVTLAEMNVKIYGVECHGYSGAFYSTISAKTGGRCLQLASFANAFDFLMAICYREQGADFFDVYEKEVRARGAKLSHDMEGMFSKLRDGVASPPTKKLTGAAKKTVTFTPAKKVKKGTASPKPVKAGKVSKPKRVSDIIPKAPKKTKKPTRPLLRREEVPENNFMLRDMSWSPWVRVISPTADPKSRGWQKRNGSGCHGFRRKNVSLFNGNKPAFYEVAVQTSFRGRRYVVYSKFISKFPTSTNWESRLFGNRDVIAQVNDVIAKGCSVFVRRVVYGRASSHVKTSDSLSFYDYAWAQQKKVRPQHRLVVKMDIVISSDDL